MNEGHRILLIEDNRPDADIIRELIKDTGIVHELIWLDNGEKAIKFFDDVGQAGLSSLTSICPESVVTRSWNS